MTMLHELHRPTCLAEVVGQPKATKIAQRVIDAGAGGKAIMLTGPSGTGKSTIAKIIAESIATGPWWIEEGDSSHFDAKRLDQIEGECHQYGGGKGGRVYILNECHGLRADQIRRLLVNLERVPNHVCWLFTTTLDGADKLFDDHIDAGPLTSRCIQIALTNQGFAEPAARRAREIAVKAGLDGQPEAAYLSLVRKRKGNLRAVLGDIEAGIMAGGA